MRSTVVQETKQVQTYTIPLYHRGPITHGMEVADAARLLVRAYKLSVDKYKQRPELKGLRLYVRSAAPSTIEELREEVKSGQLSVTYLNSDKSIYGQPGNVWFRWWHDLGHVLTGLGMTHEEEYKLAEAQLQHASEGLTGLGLTYEQRCFVLAVYLADTAGQTDYHREHGEFPEDQVAHVHQCLKDWGWFEEAA